MEQNLQPLKGIRVLEWAAHYAGPGGSAILGDLGAEVIKIEQPGVGDPARQAYRVGRIPLRLPGGRTLFFEAANRNKKSITINLKKPKGREMAYRLASKSDIFLTNMRQKLVVNAEMDYAVLSKFNPKLIYASVSAFGQEGPDSELGGYDYQGQARSGMMFSVGDEKMPPFASQFAIVDQATSIMISHQVLAALVARDRLGIGQEVHVSLLSAGMGLLYCNILIALVGGFEVPRHERAKEDPLRNYYRCADGRWIIMTMDANRQKQQWPLLCEALGHPEIATDPRFESRGKIFENRDQLFAIFEQLFAARPRDEWLRLLRQHDIICSPVHKPSDLANDPQITENNLIVDFDHPALGKIKIPGYFGHFSKTPAGTRTAAPGLGEHTDQVLTEIGGYTSDEISRLREDGVI